MFVIKYRIQLLMQSRFKKNMINEVFRYFGPLSLNIYKVIKRVTFILALKIIVVRNILKLLKRIPDKIMHN